MKKIFSLVFGLVAFGLAMSFVMPKAHAVASTTDTWTGKGASPNWSVAANWSNGVPQNGDNLIFDVSTLSYPTATINNDLSDLSIGNIAFQGTSRLGETAGSVKLSGNEISLSGGITDSAVLVNTDTPEQKASGLTPGPIGVNITIGVNLNLTANQSFAINSTSEGNPPTALNGATSSLIIGDSKAKNTLSMGINKLSLISNTPSNPSTSDTGAGIEVYSKLLGSGSIVTSSTGSLPNETAGIGDEIIFNNSNVQFNGTTVIQSGMTAITYADALGTGTITVRDGATLGYSSQTLGVTRATIALSNNLVLSGGGVTNFNGSGPQNDGTNLDGAVNLCPISSGFPVNLTLTGVVSLTGNTTMGCWNQATTVTLTNPLQTNGFILSSAPGSNTQINFTNTIPVKVDTNSLSKINPKILYVILAVIGAVALLFIILIIQLLRDNDKIYIQRQTASEAGKTNGYHDKSTIVSGDRDKASKPPQINDVK